MYASIQFGISFVEYHLFYRALLQTTPKILRRLLVIVTPYVLVIVTPYV